VGGGEPSADGVGPALTSVLKTDLPIKKTNALFKQVNSGTTLSVAMRRLCKGPK
jgi:hypothetical protein